MLPSASAGERLLSESMLFALPARSLHPTVPYPRVPHPRMPSVATIGQGRGIVGPAALRSTAVSCLPPRRPRVSAHGLHRLQMLRVRSEFPTA